MKLLVGSPVYKHFSPFKMILKFWEFPVLTEVYPPYTFVVAFSSSDGIAGLLKPITDPFKRQPRVAQRVAST